MRHLSRAPATARDAHDKIRFCAAPATALGLIDHGRQRDLPAVPPVAWERRAMSIAIRQLHPFFMGEVSGIDLARTLTPDEAATIEAGRGRHPAVVFHDHPNTRQQ